MDALEKLARIEELSRLIKPNRMAFCLELLNGKTLGVAWAETHTTTNVRSAAGTASEVMKAEGSLEREFVDLMKWKASVSAAEKLGVDKELVLGNLLKVMDRCLNPPEGERFNQSGANRSLELIGKEIGMFKSDIGPDTKDAFGELLKSIADSKGKSSPLPSGE